MYKLQSIRSLIRSRYNRFPSQDAIRFQIFLAKKKKEKDDGRNTGRAAHNVALCKAVSNLNCGIVYATKTVRTNR